MMQKTPLYYFVLAIIAVVEIKVDAFIPSGSLRLADGSNYKQGRVEMYYNSQWGTVCDDDWDSLDARVVCRQLGLGSYGTTLTGSSVTDGKGTIWLDNVRCTGTETRILSCQRNLVGNHNCGHHEDAGVRCYGTPPSTIIGGTLRLAGGSTYKEGRVEIYYNSRWGTVCDDSWDSTDAGVVCRQLGLGSNGIILTGSSVTDGTGSIWLDNVHCTGTETHILNCPSNSIGTHNCQHHEDAGVRCYGTPPSTIIGGTLRLVGGSTYKEGRVEIYYNLRWGTVCDDSWDSTDAGVVCRQLGLGSNGIILTGSSVTDGTGSIWLDNVHCTGTETHILNCPSNSIGTHNCQHHEDAGVRCYGTPPNTIIGGALRLVGGSTYKEGRVEIYYNSRWGTVCDDSWDYLDARVVCRQLGLGSYGTALTGSSVTVGTGSIWLDDVRCTGTETHILNCPSNLVGTHNCVHSEDAGVRCYGTPPPNRIIGGTLRLVGGSTYREGRVEMYYNSRWGTVCDDYWDSTDAGVVCRQLGLGSSGIILTGSSVTDGTGTIWLDDVRCTGTETHILNCPSNSIGTHNCGHHEDAGVRCYGTPPRYSIRLKSGPEFGDNEGRVEIYHNYQWKTVCDDGWGWEESDVVCKSLGYPLGAQRYYHRAHYGRGSGSIILDDVRCSGSESSLLYCQHNGIHNHNCGSHEDVSVQCAVKTYITHLQVIYGLSTACLSGYIKINTDLNIGNSGNYVYLCYKRGVRNPITGLSVNAYSASSFAVQSGYSRIYSDLNKGAGGDYIYVDYTTNSALPPIDAVTLIHSYSSTVYPSSLYVRINTDCNKGAGGQFVYICYHQPRSC